jgi:hypothetical protein
MVSYHEEGACNDLLLGVQVVLLLTSLAAAPLPNHVNMMTNLPCS